MTELMTLTTDELLDMACDLESDMIAEALRVSHAQHCDLDEAMDIASQGEAMQALDAQWRRVAEVLAARGETLC